MEYVLIHSVTSNHYSNARSVCQSMLIAKKGRDVKIMTHIVVKFSDSNVLVVSRATT